MADQAPVLQVLTSVTSVNFHLYDICKGLFLSEVTLTDTKGQIVHIFEGFSITVTYSSEILIHLLSKCNKNIFKFLCAYSALLCICINLYIAHNLS